MMRVKSTETRYGAVAIGIHWVSAAAIVALLSSGLVAGAMTDDAAKASLLRIHIVLGVTALVLTLARILWWWLADKRPAPVSGQPRWQEIAAAAVHGLLYVAILVVAFSGVAMMILSGAAAQIFFGAPLPLPDFTDYAPRLAHGLVARLMIVLLIGHVGAALYHQFIRRDRLLARMGIGK